jgi:DNA replication and repair protein RecF
MFIQALRLKDFRLFSEQIFKFEKQVCILLGPNAKGKSSVVEAINLLATGKSFRAGRVDEMVQFDQELARVKAKISEKQPSDEGLAGLDELELSLILTRGVVQGKRTRKTLYSVNRNRRRKKDFIGNLLTVVFRPEDLRLVEGSPRRRRDYLDTPISLISNKYDHSLNKYSKALRQRNKLLSLIKENKQPESALQFWDMSITKHGQIVQKLRKKFCQFVNAQVEPPLEMKLEYQPSLITAQRVEDHRQSAMAAGYTLIGPHKDDLDVKLDFSNSSKSNTQKENYQSVASYGSRGQKRLAVLWLKKAELLFLRAQTDKLPILLLDDILSELDGDSRNLVLDLVGEEQVFITTTQKSLVDQIKQEFKDAQVISLADLK